MGSLPDTHFALLSVYALLYDYGVLVIPHSAQINLQNTSVIQFTNGVYFLNFSYQVTRLIWLASGILVSTNGLMFQPTVVLTPLMDSGVVLKIIIITQVTKWLIFVTEPNLC